MLASLLKQLLADPAKTTASPKGEPSPADSTATASGAPTPSLYMASSGDEYNEFLELMRQGKRPFRRPGLSVTQEFELWLAARAKTRAVAAQRSNEATTDAQV